MDWESFDVNRFDLWPLLQGQMRRAKKVLISHLFLFLEVTSAYRKLWAKNLLMWSDFTLGSSFKVKGWLIGFGEFSLWWIQFGYNLHRFSDALGLVIGCITYWLMLIISRWPAGQEVIYGVGP